MFFFSFLFFHFLFSIHPSQVGLGHGDLQGLAHQDDSTFLNMRCAGHPGEDGRTVIVQVGPCCCRCCCCCSCCRFTAVILAAAADC